MTQNKKLKKSGTGCPMPRLKIVVMQGNSTMG
jgi:hypothetical protein